MRRAVAYVLIAGVLVATSACAAREARPETAASASAAPADAAPRSESRYREMTWEEYYADVMEKAWRRGAMVIWISPPQVRKVKHPLVADIP